MVKFVASQVTFDSCTSFESEHQITNKKGTHSKANFNFIFTLKKMYLLIKYTLIICNIHREV